MLFKILFNKTLTFNILIMRCIVLEKKVKLYNQNINVTQCYHKQKKNQNCYRQCLQITQFRFLMLFHMLISNFRWHLLYYISNNL